MKLKGKVLATGLLLGISAGFMAMIPTSHHTSAAIAVIDQRNIEEAIKTAIQTAKILTEEQKQLALQILNMKKLDISMLETLMKRNEEKEKIPLSGDLIYPDSLLKKNESLEKIWNERIGNIEDVINGNITVYDAVMQEQKRQKAIHQSAKETAEVAKETLKLDEQNLEDAKKALEASNKAEGQQQAMQAGNYILYDILTSVASGNRSKAHAEAAMATYFDAKIQEQAVSERILHNSTEISKKWVENMK